MNWHALDWTILAPAPVAGLLVLPVATRAAIERKVLGELEA